MTPLSQKLRELADEMANSVPTPDQYKRGIQLMNEMVASAEVGVISVGQSLSICAEARDAKAMAQAMGLWRQAFRNLTRTRRARDSMMEMLEEQIPISETAPLISELFKRVRRKA